MASRKPWGTYPRQDMDAKPTLEALVRAALQQARRNDDPTTVDDLTGVLDLLHGGTRPASLIC